MRGRRKDRIAGVFRRETLGVDLGSIAWAFGNRLKYWEGVGHDDVLNHHIARVKKRLGNIERYK